MERKIMNNLTSRLTMPQILQYLGYHRRKAPAPIRETASCMRALALKLAEPKRIVSIQNISVRNGSVLFNRHVFHSQSISHLLKDSQEAALFLVTIGGEITKKIERFLDQQKPSDAYILDKIASLLVENLARKTQENIVHAAGQKNISCTRRFSPGYGDWNVKEQKEIFRILQPENIGVRLTRHFMMVPEKSISAIFGMRKDGEP